MAEQLTIISEATDSQVTIPYCESVFKIYVKLKNVPTEAYIVDYKTGGKNFFQITRKNGTITIHFDENNNSYTRSCVVKIINPLDPTDITSFSFTQDVIAYGISVIEGSEIEVMRMPTERKEGCEIDKHGNPYQVVMAKIKVEGGSKGCYIADVGKYEHVEDKVTIGGVPTIIKSDIKRKFGKELKLKLALNEAESCDEYAVYNLRIENYGVPNSNKEFSYDIIVAHQNDFTYTTTVKVFYTRLKRETQSGEYLWLDNKPVTEIRFVRPDDLSKTLEIHIEDGSANGGYRWSISRVEYDSDNFNWLSFEMYPTSVVIHCAYNYNQVERKCKVHFTINGVDHTLTVIQNGFDSFDILTSDTDGIILTSATDLNDIKTIEVVGIGSSLSYNGGSLGLGSTIRNLTYHLVRVTSFYQSGNRYFYTFQITPKSINNTTDNRTDTLVLNITDKLTVSKTFILTQKAKNAEPDHTLTYKESHVETSGINPPILVLEFICQTQQPGEADTETAMLLTRISASWCDIIDVDNTTSTIRLQINENDKNVYGLARRCKLIVTHANDASRICPIVIENPPSGKGEELKVIGS